MHSNKNIANIIKILNNSKYDEKLLNEISNCAMLLCYFYDSRRQVVDKKYKIILDDMISSFLNMPTAYENIVYTNPFNIFNFSWIFKLTKKQENIVKKAEFDTNVLKLIKSNFILSNEFPIEMKSAILINLYSKEYLKTHYNDWYHFVKYSTKSTFDKSLYLTNNIIKSLLVYNSDFIDFSKKDLYEKLGVYLLLHQDYSTLIILTARVKDTFLTKLVKSIDNTSLSLSDQFGKGLILQSEKNE